MLALRAAPGAPAGLELGEVDEPRALPSEALVAVRAVSLNRGEIRRLPERAAGSVPGWDLAGEVLEGAADGTGPPAGARVVGLKDLGGAWAQRAAVPVSRLAELPAEVSFEVASTLPVAGLTALRTLAVGGSVLGRRVLVTGAAGGVGRFAVQLAARAGAHVTAVASSPERAAGLRELGADDVIGEPVADGPAFDVILESVGGPSLAAALQCVAPDGTVVSFGDSSGEPVQLQASSFYRRTGARLYAFMVFRELGRHASGPRDLATLAGLVAAGELRVEIDMTLPWRDAETAVDALMARRVRGKAVLVVD